jgi:PAS domain S-box-containing protein
MNIQEKLLGFVDESQDLYMIFDEEMKLIHANKKVKELFGITDTDFGKVGGMNFVHQSDAKRVESYIAELFSNPNQKQTATFRLIDKHKQLKPYTWKSTYYDKDKCYVCHSSKTISETSNWVQENLDNVGIIEYHPTTGALYWDESIYKFYEINCESNVNLKRMKQFFRPESLPLFESALDELIKKDKTFALELNFISGKFKSSTARFIGSKKVSDDEDKITIKVQDLTDVKRLERQSEDYKEAVDKSSIVSIADREGTLMSVNDKFCEITKYAKEELLGKNYRLLDSSYHKEEFWKDMWESILAGKVWTGEIRNKDKNGFFFWVSTTVIPFKNSVGRIYQYLVIQNDITENKKLAEELVVSEKLSSIGEISAQILHEVMTPLSIISLSIENLEDEVDELDMEDAKTHALKTNLTEVKTNYERIEEIFQNMRSVLVRKNKGRPEKTNIKSVIGKTLSLVQARLTSKKVTVNTDRVDSDALIINTESDLSQVFLNLINNAADAIEENPDRWISIFTERDTGRIKIYVQDSGKGIPLHIQDKIFESLFTTKGESTGTGLGMGVVKKLVEQHNGTIEIDNSKENTTFLLTFPLA